MAEQPAPGKWPERKTWGPKKAPEKRGPRWEGNQKTAAALLLLLLLLLLVVRVKTSVLYYYAV